MFLKWNRINICSNVIIGPAAQVEQDCTYSIVFCAFGTFLDIPVFPDTESGSINVSAGTIESCISDRTRAILIVHMTGIICDMDPIMEIANKYRNGWQGDPVLLTVFSTNLAKR